MRTKPVLITLGLIALAAAIAWWSLDRGVETPAEPAAEPAPTAEPVIEHVEMPENVLDAQPITPSPEGLYDDLEAAFERASKKPEIEYRPTSAPQLAPPQRDSDADDDGDEP